MVQTSIILDSAAYEILYLKMEYVSAVNLKIIYYLFTSRYNTLVFFNYLDFYRFPLKQPTLHSLLKNEKNHEIWITNSIKIFYLDFKILRNYSKYAKKKINKNSFNNNLLSIFYLRIKSDILLYYLLNLT